MSCRWMVMIGLAVAGASSGACKKTEQASGAAPSASAAVAPQAGRPGATGSGGGTGHGQRPGQPANAPPGSLGAECNADSDCDSGVCGHGGRGSWCAMRCKSDSDCPTPLTGGHCKESGICNR
jgi:hypothetical protein